MLRWAHGSFSLFAFMVVGGCGGVVSLDEDSQPRAETPEESGGGGSAGAPPVSESSAAGLPGSVEPRPFEDPSLHVDVLVSAAADASTLIVTVTEQESGEAVTDAVVTAGAAGETALVPYSVYSHASYIGSFQGYGPTWAVSVARGDEPPINVVVEGPSASSLMGFVDPTSGVFCWYPADEAAVTATICASAVELDWPYVTSLACVETPDTGQLQLDAAGVAELFPYPGLYRVDLQRTRSEPTPDGEERRVDFFTSMEVVVTAP